MGHKTGQKHNTIVWASIQEKNRKGCKKIERKWEFGTITLMIKQGNAEEPQGEKINWSD